MAQEGKQSCKHSLKNSCDELALLYGKQETLLSCVCVVWRYDVRTKITNFESKIHHFNSVGNEGSTTLNWRKFEPLYYILQDNSKESVKKKKKKKKLPAFKGNYACTFAARVRKSSWRQELLHSRTAGAERASVLDYPHSQAKREVSHSFKTLSSPGRSYRGAIATSNFRDNEVHVRNL